MMHLETIDTFYVTGKGMAHSVQPPPDEDPREWPGRMVMLDGDPVWVKGVETSAVPDVRERVCSIIVERAPAA